MRERFSRFMQGRHGADQLSNFLVIAALVLVVLEIFIPIPRVRHAMNSLGVGFILFSYFRMFSRNHARRYEENEWFLKYFNRVRFWWNGKKARSAQRKNRFGCLRARAKLPSLVQSVARNLSNALRNC